MYIWIKKKLKEIIKLSISNTYFGNVLLELGWQNLKLLRQYLLLLPIKYFMLDLTINFL